MTRDLLTVARAFRATRTHFFDNPKHQLSERRSALLREGKASIRSSWSYGNTRATLTDEGANCERAQGPNGRRARTAQGPDGAGPERREVPNVVKRRMGPALFDPCALQPLRRLPLLRKYEALVFR